MYFFLSPSHTQTHSHKTHTHTHTYTHIHTHAHLRSRRRREKHADGPPFIPAWRCQQKADAQISVPTRILFCLVCCAFCGCCFYFYFFFPFVSRYSRVFGVLCPLPFSLHFPFPPSRTPWLCNTNEQESKKLGKASFLYAWVLDESEEERARCVCECVCVCLCSLSRNLLVFYFLYFLPQSFHFLLPFPLFLPSFFCSYCLLLFYF